MPSQLLMDMVYLRPDDYLPPTQLLQQSRILLKTLTQNEPLTNMCSVCHTLQSNTMTRYVVSHLGDTGQSAGSHGPVAMEAA